MGIGRFLTRRVVVIDKAKIPDVLVFKIVDLLWWLRSGGCWPWCDDGGELIPPEGGYIDEWDGWC